MKGERARAEVFHEALSATGRPVDAGLRPLIEVVRTIESALLPGPEPAAAARIDHRFEAALREPRTSWWWRAPLRAGPVQLAAGLLLFAAGGVSAASAMGVSPVDAATSTVSFVVNAVSSLVHINDDAGATPPVQPTAAPETSGNHTAGGPQPGTAAEPPGATPDTPSNPAPDTSPADEPRLAGFAPPVPPAPSDPGRGTPPVAPTPTPTPTAAPSAPRPTTTPRAVSTLAVPPRTTTPNAPATASPAPTSTATPTLAAPSRTAMATSTPSPSPSASPSSIPVANPTAIPPPPQAPSATPPPAAASSTYDAAPGGTVTLQIESDWLTVLAANPANGWTVVIDKGAGSDVQVKFVNGSQVVQFWAGVEAGVVTVHVESSS